MASSQHSSSPVNIGLIGCGVIGQHHAKAVAASARTNLWAVADLRKDAAQEVGKTYDAQHIYDNAESILTDDNVDAVILAMPAHVRTDIGLHVFAAGKHLLTEKPVAMNSTEVKRLIDAKGELVGACCSARYRYLQASRTVTDFIASGALGKLRLVRCRAIIPAGPPPQSEPPVWRLKRSLNGGGILMNWGCYDLDYLLGITGWTLQPQVVLADAWTIPNSFASYAAPESDAETHVSALIRCANGVSINYERAEFIAAQRELTWEIIGEDGSLHLQMTPAPYTEHTYFQADIESGTDSRPLCETTEDHMSVHLGPVDDLARAIQEGSEPKTSLEQALIIQQITDAIYLSAETGNAIQIEEISS